MCHVIQQCRDGSYQTNTTQLTALRMALFAPVITSQPEREVKAFGDQLVELRCSAEGFPLPSFQWSKNDQDLLGKTSPILLVMNINITLRYSSLYINFSQVQINNVTEDDGGRYSCLISNSQGSIVTRTAVVTVETFRPLNIVHQPRFQNDAAILMGTTIYLECRATGPEPICYQVR